MDLHAGKIVLNGAPSQYDRWLPALDSNYAPVDGRSFSDLLNFPVKYGALLNFYNLRDEVDGDWVGFFLSDPTMMLAALESADTAALEREFARLYDLTRASRDYARKFDHLCQLFAFIQGLARRVNDALVACTGPPERDGVGSLLEDALATAIVMSLGPQLRKLKAYAEGAGLPRALGQAIPLDWNGFLPIWALREDCPDASIYHGLSRIGKIDHALPYLVPIFAAFQESFVDFQTFARANFEASLEEPDHKPQIGLYIAFARLFASAQATINTMSSRYVHFYYRDMLRETPAGAIGDRVYVTFTLADDETVRSTTVPAGTGFPAGQDAEGRDILYASERSLQVAASQIDAVRTLRLVRGPLAVEPASGSVSASTTKVTQRILGSDIALAVAAKKSIPWSTFGVTYADPTPVTVTTPATLGFAIGTSSLMLTGGQRDIEIVVSYSETFKKDRLDPLLDELAGIVGLDRNTILSTVLDDAFTVFASSEAGWFALPSYKTALPDDGEPTFTLHMTLPPTAPPVVAYDPGAAEGEAAPLDAASAAANPAPNLPTFKFYLCQRPVTLTPPAAEPGTAVDVYPLSLLDGMPVETLQIVTDVEKLPGLELQSTTGPVDPASPFALFGSPAVVGSYLDIRKDELFVKRIESLDITIDWFNLPANSRGFKGYYRDYKIGLDGREKKDLFNNRSFLGSIAVTDPGSWEIDGDDTGLFLFKTEPSGTVTDPAAPLCPAVTFDFPAKAVVDHTPPAYYAPSDGAIRLTLTAPPYAFGDDLYAQNVLHAVISDLPDPTTCQQTCEAKYALLAEAAQSIGECLNECGPQREGPFRDCITNCLDGCIAQLLLSAADCLWECAETSQPRLSADAFTRMKTSFDEANGAPQQDRAKRLDQWVETWRDVAAIEKPCLDTCMFLLDAAMGIGICLASCSGEPPDTYRAAILSCVQGCQAKLQEAYAQFVEKCIADCSKPKDKLNYPNAPWLPTAQSVTVSYRADNTVFGSDAGEGAFFHLTPFGGYQQMVAPAPLLPVIADEGSLYLGFNGLAPPQALTLLFQMAANDGSAMGGDAAPVRFDYLSRNQWIPIGQREVAADGTNGLENSGILALNLPAYDPAGNTVLAGDRQWLRASVATGAALFPDTIGIYPNATTALWQDIAGGGNTLDRPLPPHTIVSSVQPLPDIDSIDQPMESFGGRPAEGPRDFQMRLGERLRHKDRAIAGWDYERLVLARFPTIWKAQALPARNAHHGNAPGDVLVVVVGGPDCLDVADPTIPSASGALLGAIQQYLEGHTSPFVRVHVVNPIYVRITVVATVQFATDDVGAAITRLNDDLVRYLSPWFYDAARATKGGRYANKEEIEAFIEAQPEVDGLWGFDVSYDRPIDDLDWYFLTSAKQHNIAVADFASPGKSTVQQARISMN